MTSFIGSCQCQLPVAVKSRKFNLVAGYCKLQRDKWQSRNLEQSFLADHWQLTLTTSSGTDNFLQKSPGGQALGQTIETAKGILIQVGGGRGWQGP